MNCPYCGRLAEFLTSKDFYGKCYKTNVYVCRPCDARVGTHGKGSTPLGTMANAELRKWRASAHSVFDMLWKKKHMSRTGAYRWLTKVTGLPPQEAHIALFNIEQCKWVIERCKDKLSTFTKKERVR